MKRGVNKQSLATGSIRVVSGQFRGRKLPVLNVQGLRPTTDRNKETLFNWLMPYTNGSRCLDMFAGSGSLGVEALSRYAESVTFIEKDVAAAKMIEQNLTTLSVDKATANVVCGDALQVLPRLNQTFDIVLIDPPFHSDMINSALAGLQEHQCVDTDSVIYVESETQNANYSIPSNWLCIKEKQSSSVCARLFKVQ